MALIEHTFNLSGNVRHQGLSLAQVQIFLYDLYQDNFDQSAESYVAQIKTGSKGDFSFSVKPGVYRLEIVPDGKTRFLAQSVPEIKVTTNTNLSLSLSTGCIVSGRVATGYGFEGNRSELFLACEVVALGIEPTSYKSTAGVDETGAFSLIIPRGKYYFALRSSLFVATDCQIFHVNGDCDLTLGLPSFVKFEGEVVDIFGTPIEAATIKMLPAASTQNVVVFELNMQAEAQTDSEGRFCVELQEGDYDLSIDPGTASTYFALRENEIEVKGSPGARLQRRFTLQEGHRLRGQVCFNEQPLSQALVRVQASQPRSEYIARTDGDGHFALSLPGGSYKVIVAAHPKDAPAINIDGHEYSALAPWTSAIILGADSHIEVNLVEGTALLGRICDDALLARPGVQVQIFADIKSVVEPQDNEGDSTALITPDVISPDAIPPDSSSAVLTGGITDGEGKYGVFLSSGNYWLVIHRDFANARYVQIDNEPVSLDITWHGWSQLSFTVVGEAGQAVPRCQVFYHPYGQEADEKPPLASSAMPLPHGYVLTTEEGACRLTLPAGVYTFKFVPPADGSFGQKIIRQLSISSDISRRVTLDTKKIAAAVADREKKAEAAHSDVEQNND